MDFRGANMIESEMRDRLAAKNTEIDRLCAELADAKAALTRYGDQGAFQALRDGADRAERAEAELAEAKAHHEEWVVRHAQLNHEAIDRAERAELELKRRIEARAKQPDWEQLWSEAKESAERAEAERDVAVKALAELKASLS